MSKIYGTPIMAGGSGGANKDLPPLLDNFKAFEGGVVDDGLTRLKDLPNGTKVKFGNYNDQTLVWRIAQDEGVTKAVLDLDYNTGKTVIGDMVVSPNKSICGNWAITGWLNATEVGDSWWDNRVRYSGYPSETEPTYSSQDGFLHGWSVADKEVLRGVVWDCDDKRSSPNSYQLWCRLMIASKDEVELAWNGERFCASLGTAACMTRTSHVQEEYYAISPMGTSISAGGYITNDNLNQPQGIWPVCAPNPEAVVSAEPDDDGCYVIDYAKRTVGDLQVGDKIKVSVNADAQSFLGENIVFQVAAHNHPTHPENSATLITEKIIACIAIDAAETSYPNGNPNYSLSNLNQWLNSNAGAGQWWSATHDGDVAPAERSVDNNPYSQRAGFLNMLDGGFVKSLLETHKQPFESDGVTQTAVDVKVFIPSYKEVASSSVIGDGIHQLFPLFESGNESKVAYLTNVAAESNGVDTAGGSDLSWHYLSCDQITGGGSYYAVRRNYGTNATPYYFAPKQGNSGIRPACNISNSLPLVSGTPDEEGCYLVDWDKINVTIQADKMAASRANELAGAVWVYADHEPTSVNDGTKIQLSRDEVVAPSISTLESGSKVRLGTYNGEPLGWIVARDTVTQELRLVLDADSVATIGTMQYDAEEPSNPNPNRQSSGNNRYSVSNINQWLNSDGAANEWYTAQHEYDAPPSYQNKAGFLNEWSNNDKVILQNKEWVTTLTSIDGSGTDTFSQRIVLMSTTELGLQEDTGGNKLDIFNSNSDRLTGSGSYWTRTPHPSTAPSVYDVTAAGSLNTYGNADGSISVRPICAPNPSTPVSGPDDEGYYTIGGVATVQKTVQWNNEANFFARQFTYNSKKQYQTMLEGAVATITLVGVPEPVSELAETHSGSSITLTWKNPTSDEFYDHTVVVYKTDAFPTAIDDGTQGYSGTDETATLSGLELGSTYYIAVFTVSAYGLYGEPQTVQVEIPAGLLISSLASGTKVKLGKWNNTDLQWKVTRDTSDQSIRLVLEPTSVSLLGNKQYDAPEPSNSDMDRKLYGNNRYIYSNIHQWLNATKATGWYVAQHSADVAPAYSSSPGFLSGWSENHINALDGATLTTSRARVDGGGTETFVARVALISTTELGLQNSTGGERLDIFNSDGDRATGSLYWTRTPYSSNSYFAYQVSSSGTLFSNNIYVRDALRVRPLCIPVSTALVSPEMDEDNCYIVQ